MNLRSLVGGCVMDAVLHSLSRLPSHQTIHTSAVVFKKKRQPFYNRFAKQLLNRKKIYTGYAYEVLQRQEERILTHSDDREDEDFEEELLREGRQRREAYFHSRRMRELHKGAGPRLLTWDQMEHVRFLRQTDPEEWDVHTLAHSFQVPELVIRKVLHNKKVLRPWLREKLNKKAREKQGIIRLPHASADEATTTTALTTPEENSSLPTFGEWGLPNWKDVGWFSGYENARLGNSDTRNGARVGDSYSLKQDYGVSWLDDEECEFYEELYRAQEPPPPGDDEWEQDSGLEDEEEDDEQNSTLSADDDKNFFDSTGEFVYKI